MITSDEALELAEKAHKGQWRRPRPLPKTKVYMLNDYPNFSVQGFFINPDGNKVSYIGEDTWSEQEPYITHPIAVADMMATCEERIVAILHDTIEDTPATLCINADNNYYIYYCGEHQITKNVYGALSLLTHYKEMTYDEYIHNLVEGNVRYEKVNTEASNLAAKVKLADIFHNLSDSPSSRQKEKYLKAIPILLGAL